MATGKAGVHLVCADLIMQGYIAFPSEEALPFDVVSIINNRIYKIQVKTTRKPRRLQRRGNNNGYLFHITRMGKGGKKNYSEEDVDLFALVALDSHEIGYLSRTQIKRTMIFKDKSIYEDVIKIRDKITSLKSDGMNTRNISKEIGIKQKEVLQIYSNNKTFRRSWRFISDYTLGESLVNIAITNHS